VPQNPQDTVVVLDFGGQYSHLIARRIRECEVYSELLPWNTKVDEILARTPKAIILSGGPASVNDLNAPRCQDGVFDLGIPVLGICYGLQLMVDLFGGKIARPPMQEYGRTTVYFDEHADLFKGLGPNGACWMSHADSAANLPDGFQGIAHSEHTKYAAIRNRSRLLFGVQFHPEVVHTVRGMEIIRNFLFEVANCRPTWKVAPFAKEMIAEIRRTVGKERVLCAVSGGVDSTTTAALVKEAVADQLMCIFVDHGLMRKGEPEKVRGILESMKLRTVYVEASERFLERLKGISDPEQKRRIIGEEFVRVFTEVANEHGKFEWLAQGTLYPDVIESAHSGSPASKIKTHHNVAGLPQWTEFKLIEPLRFLYKDEVRKVASTLGIPTAIIARHPFPGPGLAVRILGEVNEEKLAICREASDIVESELRADGIYERVWQAFAMVGDDLAVGVLGDERKLGHVVTVRIVESVDGMTADWVRIPDDLLTRISSRITNEVKDVTWVTYAISSKPPSTIEPC
jgi:GMP synthase (glutamine-hydrolysing)